MTFDGVEKTFEDFTFTYYPNPIIDGIDRTVSIMSGGLDIKLTGQRFDLIQEPRIIVSSLTTDASNSELCNGTETLLICPTPNFPDHVISTRRRRASNGVMTANLTFDFDGYIVDGGFIDYYPDPVYESFSGPNRIYASSNGRLDITGIGLDLASMEDDVQVLLGPNGVCHVDVLEIDVVRCQLPEKQPLAGYENGSLGQGPAKNLPAVTVLHGNVRFSPGFVSAWATKGNPLIAIVIPVVIVVPIWIIIPMIILVWWFRKKQLEVKRAKEEVKMIRMNILKRVREVSNTSLDLSEADDRVQKQGVPFVGHVQYVTMMLFAGLGTHPETTEPEYMEDFMEHSLVSFYRMLKEKAGMIEFIRQLENKKTGLGRERELIASLLAITFVSEGKSIHFTSVLTSLVEDEIVTASESRRRMDTLFTNTESIAVKLISNWFALFMFEYLKVYGVYPLYMLYQAVKAQAEKGPIDVVTGDAYYTLEFSKLLDQEIDFHSLGIDVVDEDGHVYLHMTVLDVDTVKQAKQKILDSLWKKSYCLLPRDIDAVDLVWIQTSGRTTLLQDIDKSSETQGKTMINTMKSFGIRNGSLVALIPKNHGDEYQTLDLKEVSSKTYESLQHVTVEMIPESQLSQPASNAIHLKGGVEELTRKKSNLPDHMNQMKANLDRNLAIPHMLTMKASISPYVDGIFEVIFKKPAKIPLPVKYLFDTFDALAIKYAGGGLPEDCADKWKKNCLSNFWSSVLTNLPSMFEMPRSETADRFVIALAGALNDAATTKTLRQAESDHLPYYNEHPLQRKMMTDYCTQVTSQPKVRPGKLNKACSSISKEFKGQFSHLSNLLHLYNLTKNDMDGLVE
ncbi:plexin-A4-like [Strongylocentrotus purpuratus]|uniref:Uncharacterized protein n=1 Tax=Strongylocentrotus purpuratus TaxID=7668 RepID=A0A7M7NP52_STRPU|nr:plexin-A4-like [Strongylocentrotus purpuratus]